MSSAVSGFGVTFSWGGNEVAELVDITPNEISAEDIDLTHHGSSDNFREYTAGPLEGGEVTLSLNFIAGDTNGQVVLASDAVSPTNREGIITFTDGSTMTFTGYVKKFTPTSPLNDAYRADVAIKVTGKPVFAVSLATGPTDISASTGTLSPDFAAGTYLYTLAVATGTATVDITPTFATGTCTINGASATSEAATSVTLGAAGTVTEIEVIFKETGKGAKIYTIYAGRPSS